jgi:DNA-binding CsgD family transcriptional regulator
MLQLARDLKAGLADEEVETPPALTYAPSDTPSYARLSKKEVEVAKLVLRGMPYKAIGEQLAISPKTVEHHVARIRRRLGAESRSEMLSMLRALVEPQG